MELINSKSRMKELILFLHGAPKSHVIAVCVYLNKMYGTDIPTYVSKGDLIHQLGSVDREELFEAIDHVFEDDGEEELEEFDLEDDESEDDDCDESNDEPEVKIRRG